jgi:hypothetical protein
VRGDILRGYQDPISAEAIQAGLDAAAQDAGVTMLVVPEATLLGGEDHAMVVHAMLHQCGALGDRIALLDVPGGDASAWSPDAPEDPVERFREAIGGNPYLRYGIAYFPSSSPTLSGAERSAFAISPGTTRPRACWWRPSPKRPRRHTRR